MICPICEGDKGGFEEKYHGVCGYRCNLKRNGFLSFCRDLVERELMEKSLCDEYHKIFKPVSASSKNGENKSKKVTGNKWAVALDLFQRKGRWGSEDNKEYMRVRSHLELKLKRVTTEKEIEDKLKELAESNIE